MLQSVQKSRTIVSFVATMRYVASEKGDYYMKKNVIKRVVAEMRSYREKLVTGNYTALQLFGEAYQIVTKQEIVDAIERLGEENKFPEYLWKWLDSKEEVLEYLYQLMIHSDHSFSTELMELLRVEVEYDREVHGNE